MDQSDTDAQNSANYPQGSTEVATLSELISTLQ